MNARAALFAASIFALVPTIASTADALPLSAAERKALGITSVPVESMGSEQGIKITGSVVAPPGRSVPASSPIDAAIVEYLVVAGMHVEAGAPIARLYSPEYESLRADLETQRLTLNHMAHLAERSLELQSLGLRSAQEVEEAGHDAEASRLNYSASIKTMTGLRKAEASGQFFLLAPAAGTVLSLDIAAGATAPRSQPILRLFKGGNYWLRAGIPERLAMDIDVGSTLSVGAAETPAKIVSVNPVIDAATRSVEVLAELPASERWRIGQLVDVRLDMQRQPGSISIPSRAIVRIGGKTSVFLDRGTSVELIEVDIETQDRDTAVVKGAIEPKDKIVTSGLAALKNLAASGG